jgi:acid phosphatase
LGRQDTNKSLANVYNYAASTLGYTNVAVPNVPMSNAAITGLLTGKSYNETHS